MTRNKAPKKQPPRDWHNADIVCALRKAGWSLRKLSVHHGYKNPRALSHALQKPWPKGEKLIADEIGVPPQQIWPSRYQSTSRRLSREREAILSGEVTS